MINDFVFMNNLKEIRLDMGLSQSALSELVGVSRNTISSIERGKWIPSTDLALCLCLLLNKSFNDVFWIEKKSAD